MSAGRSDPLLLKRCQQTRGEDSERRFVIVADLTRGDKRTLEVYYDPDRIYLSINITDERVWERDIAIPTWADTETTKAVINNGILTVTVGQRQQRHSFSD